MAVLPLVLWSGFYNFKSRNPESNTISHHMQTLWRQNYAFYAILLLVPKKNKTALANQNIP